MLEGVADPADDGDADGGDEEGGTANADGPTGTVGAGVAAEAAVRWGCDSVVSSSKSSSQGSCPVCCVIDVVSLPAVVPVVPSGRKEGGAESPPRSSGGISSAFTGSGGRAAWTSAVDVCCDAGRLASTDLICCAELGRRVGDAARMARCSKAEEGRGEMERLRSPATRTSTGVGVPPRGVKPKNMGGWMEVNGGWTLGP